MAAILSMDISLAQIGQELLAAPPAWTLRSTTMLLSLLFVSETRSHYIAQADLEFMILLSQSPYN